MAWSIVYSPGGGGSGNTINAASAALADVQAAVDAAADGDTVLIPNGSATWSTGITTTKQIIIRAQNYTPTSGGTMTRNVTITHNAGTSQLFNFTTGNNYSCGVIGIRFNAGTGTGNYVRFTGSGTKPPLIGDCSYQCPNRFGNNPGESLIAMMALGGVIYNTYGLNASAANIFPGGSGIFVDSPLAWTTASTMGTLDTSGNVNVYIEDSTFKDVSILADVDSGGRLVIRHCTADGSFFETHGYSSGMYGGGRHVEIYDNTLARNTSLRNTTRYFWLRAGTFVATGNVISDPLLDGYGFTSAFVTGDASSQTPTNDLPMSPGWGHNGTTDVRDAIYIWSNTGPRASDHTFANGWDATVQVASSAGDSTAELFIDKGAKPGWTRYTYPHPARI